MSQKKCFFLEKIATFFQLLQKESEIGVLLLCKESHVSTRTYYKIMKYKPVKPECYHRLFMGCCRAVTDEEKFMEHWELLGKGLYWRYGDD